MHPYGLRRRELYEHYAREKRSVYFSKQPAQASIGLAVAAVMLLLTVLINLRIAGLDNPERV